MVHWFTQLPSGRNASHSAHISLIRASHIATSHSKDAEKSYHVPRKEEIWKCLMNSSTGSHNEYYKYQLPYRVIVKD